MNRKISLGIIVGLIILAITVSSAITVGVMSKEYNDLLQGLPEKLERYGIIDELDDIINNYYYGKNDSATLEQAIAEGYVQSLGDGSSRYMSAAQYSEYLSERNGHNKGIGIEYMRTAESYMKITKVYPSSPAALAGLQPDDIIIGFDGIILDADNYAEMESKLKGDKLVSVNLVYKRGDTETTLSLVKGYEATSVVTDVYGTVGYIEILDFYPSTPEQVQQAVDKFTSSQLEAIVIDLRSNSSDNYEIAMQILDIFVPMSDSSKPAATVVDENGNVVRSYSMTAGEVNIPIGVLVSTNTVQAAELFACNLREFGKGLIFAQSTTGGYSLVQEIFELSTGSAVLLTTGRVLPYSGVSFEETGVAPDYVLEAYNGEDKISADNQFLYAVSVLVSD